MIGRVALILAALAAAPAWADSPMRTDRETFLRQLRAEIDAADLIAPIPDPECRKPSVLRWCSAPVNAAITMDLTDSFDFFEGDPESKRRPAIEAMLSGGIGRLYEASFTLKDATNEVAERQFEGICISAIAVLQQIPRRRAAESYRAALRRAVNGLGRSELSLNVIKVRSTKLTMEAERTPARLTCRLNAADVDH